MRRNYTTISLTTQMIRLQAIKSPGITVLHIAPQLLFNHVVLLLTIHPM